MGAARAAPVVTVQAAVADVSGKKLVIATRGSKLALWQANYIKDRLELLNPDLNVVLDIIRTRGDIIQDVPLAKVGGKGLFVKEIEEALLAGRADLAVHSIKDVPMFLPDGLVLGCIPKREACTDSFLSNIYASIQELPKGAKVGTSSLRRQAQLLAMRPDLQICPLRGNIDTRLAKLERGDFDAIILASAGLARLGLKAARVCPLATDDFIPASGQGALGIECLADNSELLALLAKLDDYHTRVCVLAERAFLTVLDGGCQAPIAVNARFLDSTNIYLQGLVAEIDGSVIFRTEKSGPAAESEKIGQAAAQELLDNGARQLLQKIYANSN